MLSCTFCDFPSKCLHIRHQRKLPGVSNTTIQRTAEDKILYGVYVWESSDKMLTLILAASGAHPELFLGGEGGADPEAIYIIYV
jgi:hypothetical protein